ncbi:tetratricopeptide repeat protein, partial [bacterium]
MINIKKILSTLLYLVICVLLISLLNSFVFAETVPIEENEADYAYIVPLPISKYGINEDKLFKEAGTSFALLNKKDTALELFRKFIAQYPDNALTAKSQYMIAECEFLNAAAMDKEKRGKLINQKINKKLDSALTEYYKVLDETNDTFLKNNVWYRIAECYYAKKEFNKIFEISGAGSFYYLDQDMLYLLGLTYLKSPSNGKLTEEQWNKVQGIFEDLVSINIGKGEVILALGLTLFGQGKYKEALEKFSQVGTDDGRYFTGKCYEKMNKYLLAAGEYKSLIREYPESRYLLKAYFSIAETLYDSSDYIAAIDEYNKFVEMFPKSRLKYYALYKIGCSYFKRNKYNEALSSFSSLISKTNLPVEVAVIVQYLIGETYYNLDNIDSAITNYKLCMQKYPETEEGIRSNYLAAWCYYYKKHYSEAENFLLKNIQKIPVNHILYNYAYFLLGNAQYMHNNYQDALISYQTVTDQCDKEELINLRDAAFGMLNLISYKLKDYRKIATEYHYVLNKIMPTPADSIWRMRTYFIVGDASYRLGYIDLAEKLFSKIADIYSKDDYIYSYALDSLAWCYFKRDDYVEAEQYRKKIVDVLKNSDKKRPELEKSNYFELGNILFNQKKYMDALDYYETFIQVAKGDTKIPETLYRLGRCYYRLEYFSNAIEKWDEIAVKHPQSSIAPLAAYKVADTYFKAGKYSDAVKKYRFIISKAKGAKTEYKVKESYLRIGQSFFNAKNFRAAVTAFKEFIVKYPKDKDAVVALDGIESSLYRKKERMIMQGKVKDTIVRIAKDLDDLFKDYVRTASNAKIMDEITLRIAKNYYDEDSYPNAVIKFRKYFSKASYDVNLSTKISEAQFYLAESHFFSKQYKGSINAYKVLIGNFPNNKYIPQAYFRIATSFFKLKEYEGAIKAYTTLISSYSASNEYSKMAQYNLGFAYKSADKLDEASAQFIKYYDGNSENPNALDLMIDAGDIFIKQREYQKAIGVFKRIVDKVSESESMRLQFKIAEAYEKSGDNTSAVSEYLVLREKEPYNDISRLSGLVKLAELYERLE